MIEEKNIIVCGIATRYFVRPGNGTPIVFLHGWRSEGNVWLSIFPKIPDLFSLFAVDLPGFGKSDKPPKAFTVSDYGEVIREFIEKLGFRSVCLVGHSFGGRVAIKLAAEQPGYISRVVLAGSAGVRERPISRSILAAIAKIVKPIFRLSLFQGLRRKIYRAIGAGDYVATPELKETFVRVVGEDLRPLLPKISQPTLLIWGENDQVTPLRQGEQMREWIPNAALITIKNAGHFSFLDQPEEFSRHLNAFLATQ